MTRIDPPTRTQTTEAHVLLGEPMAWATPPATACKNSQITRALTARRRAKPGATLAQPINVRNSRVFPNILLEIES